MPILETRSLRWPDEAACAATAQWLATQPAVRDAVVELQGELGAGKTTFVRYLLRALGVTGRIKSPSYAVVEPYAVAGWQAWHFDFYRFADPREWEEAGFRELFAAPGLKLCEWPERMAGRLPPADLHIAIAFAAEADDDHGRRVEFHAGTPKGLGLLPR